MNEEGWRIGPCQPITPTYTFCEGVLILDKDGMVYKGSRIDDAGEAHKAFMETMRSLGWRGI